jgi:hypothetical protein
MDLSATCQFMSLVNGANLETNMSLVFDFNGDLYSLRSGWNLLSRLAIEQNGLVSSIKGERIQTLFCLIKCR